MAHREARVEAGVETHGFHRVWLRIGLLSFGGPAGQIALMHRELVDRLKWLDDAEYLRALNFCTLLPGPEAQQLATWCGWRLRGWRGGLAAGLLFVLPGALVMAALTLIYLAYGALPVVAAVFDGVQAVVLAVVAQALARLAGRTLKGALAWSLAAAAFVALFFLDAPFPLVVVVAGAIGWLAGRRASAGATKPDSASWLGSLRTALLWLAIWAAPIALAALILGPAHPLTELGAFFARVAALTFGGAYAAMAWVAQAAVEARGWLAPEEMLDGLALAETTPGPLVLVFQFVGGLAAARFDSAWPQWLGALLGMAMALWVVFAPSFLWIFSLAPHLDRLTRRPALAAALAGVTAAVVGVMANLAIWFALHVLFARVTEQRLGPVRLWTPGGSFDWLAALLALAALALLVRARAPLPLVLALGAAAGLARWTLNGG